VDRGLLPLPHTFFFLLSLSLLRVSLLPTQLSLSDEFTAPTAEAAAAPTLCSIEGLSLLEGGRPACGSAVALNVVPTRARVQLALWSPCSKGGERFLLRVL